MNSPVPSTSTPSALASAGRSGVLEDGILRAVWYGDVFDHPLRSAEVHRYLVGVSGGPDEVDSAIQTLVGQRRLEEHDGFFFVPGRRDLVTLRRRRARGAARLWPEARKYGRRIARLPFVRMVAVTGSLARDSAEPGGDVDYLVVTEPDRLWVARALVGLLTRVARRRGIVLCANYFLSERALEIPERNLYTAYELAQMVPLVGPCVYMRMVEENGWIAEHLPNSQPLLVAEVHESSRGWLRRVVEILLRTPPGGWLDRLERVRKRRNALGRGQDLSEARFEPDCFKGHFDGHGRRTLDSYRSRLHRLEKGGP